ncbi:prolyl oligopeptidase family serine peptidase [Rosenbergiella sp. S61]|uniref:Prolyl oligopeptidase family serine peptidase n=1 Tax=Rosenbergiella gaditana TaxID=2726987 RepID=A0ABS5SWJ3_9GAMM|nr:prolyl oligopeptidase family serine peptidase [Rosenbergiella gaditana]MBT0723133.1 prolyl oligopeptidase family serine peptidase [Rosenbergiella gaditana]
MKKLVILLHGYGSDGNDLKGLGEFWAGALPGLRYASPNAPEPCEAGMGYQWFSFADITPQNIKQRLTYAREAIDAVLSTLLQQHDIDAAHDQIVLVGFSQGTMIALDLLLRRHFNVIGVVGFSGRLIEAPTKAATTAAEVLLIHGEADEVVPAQETLTAQATLNQLGIPCQVMIEPELVHTISAAGVEAATQFLIERFGWEDEEDEE